MFRKQLVRGWKANSPGDYGGNIRKRGRRNGVKRSDIRHAFFPQSNFKIVISSPSIRSWPSLLATGSLILNSTCGSPLGSW